MTETDNKPLLSVRGLKKHFVQRRNLFGKAVRTVRAVDGVDLDIERAETLGLVGESGCGKSTLGRAVLKLIEPTAGTLVYDGEDITNFSAGRLRPWRKKMQIIFQDPFASLNPRMSVGNIIGEALDIHRLEQGPARTARVAELLDTVGLRKEAMHRYPHEFSGGQRQRIGIARALAVRPEFIVCDEPISALDVSIQAQVVNLLQDLQSELGLTYLFIAHDLTVVEHISTRVAVMYLGRIVEIAEAKALYAAPHHPYTKALFSAVPRPDPENKHERILLHGEIPSPLDPPSGCTFHPRCSEAMDICKTDSPQLVQIGARHQTACHLYTEAVSPPAPALSGGQSAASVGDQGA